MNIDLAKFEESAKDRRLPLTQKMDRLGESNINCRDCPGECCTFTSNSMQVTPIEAIDMMIYLKKQSQYSTSTFHSLENCIKKYRLDGPTLSNGKKIFMRRTYTCPFFGGGELGCTIDPEYKPYGCLAFNPTHISFKADSHCHSDKEQLLRTDEQNVQIHEQLSADLVSSLKLDWEKLPIPVAIVRLWDFL
ncbi:MAG: hypothetical protein HOE90_20560 [Bacteriovoracaceae bacterium]|jgi:hypothetical protein|nr:hypothetical protein [Bacteriovoracaceae bacterium]